MQNYPFFSVLVPTYNQAEYLIEALDSLIAQTDPDWEAIVVNDGSTDFTSEVLEGYCRKDQRFQVIDKENGGVASALNAGLRQAKGEWICWLSSDDLFDRRKLEIHREWLLKHPNCHFFFSHFRELDDATGQISDPPLWRTIPEREWQVLEMLRCTYIHGNSICVHRDAWAQAGMFNEELRYGQDYDMWLRLLTLYPATFIPERTCTTRRHALQGSHIFPEACFFDSAKAAINFLNQHSFAELVPLVDLSDLEMACKAVVKALDVAADPCGFLYTLGPHPALLLRIMEWAWDNGAQEVRGRIQQIIRQKAREVSWQFQGTAFGFFWKAAATASRLPRRKFVYQWLSPAMVAEMKYWLLKSAGSPEAEPLHRYLESFENRVLPKDVPAPQGKSKEVVVVCQGGTHLTDATKYGTFRATIEISKYLMRAGRMVLLTGLSSQGMGFTEGVLFVGADDDRSWSQAVASLGPIDTLVGISRADIFRIACARRYLVYHHGPHPVLGMSVETLNRTRVPVVCVSQYSRSAQILYGMHHDLLHVVPNAYNSLIFSGTGNGQRLQHSLIYAGHVVDYKGLDIALQAFAIVKSRFPDAVFHVYGRTYPWRKCTKHLFASGWLDREGFPVWLAIERDLPGFRYCGEVSQPELADALRQHCLMIMPSRIVETFGIVSLEAQACGCIPVLPRQGGFPETIKEGKTGYLYDENTPESLAAKILELWENGLPTDSQRTEAQQWVQETFSWEKSGATFLEIIESVPIRTCRLQILFHYLLVRWEQLNRGLGWIERVVTVAWRTLGSEPVTRWPGLLKNLWMERQ